MSRYLRSTNKQTVPGMCLVGVSNVPNVSKGRSPVPSWYRTLPEGQVRLTAVQSGNKAATNHTQDGATDNYRESTPRSIWYVSYPTHPCNRLTFTQTYSTGRRDQLDPSSRPEIASSSKLKEKEWINTSYYDKYKYFVYGFRLFLQRLSRFSCLR